MDTSFLRFLDELGAPCQSEVLEDSITDSVGLLTVPTMNSKELTPNSSPSSSPASVHRARHDSISDPLPAITLEVEGLCRKVCESPLTTLFPNCLCLQVDEMVTLLQSKLLASVVKEVAPALKKDTPGMSSQSNLSTRPSALCTPATLKEFCEKLNACKKQVSSALSTPGSQLSSAVQGLVDTANTYTQEVGLFVSLSLADCDSKLVLTTHEHRNYVAK